jgi:hypothetical protein
MHLRLSGRLGIVVLVLAELAPSPLEAGTKAGDPDYFSTVTDTLDAALEKAERKKSRRKKRAKKNFSAEKVKLKQRTRRRTTQQDQGATGSPDHYLSFESSGTGGAGDFSIDRDIVAPFRWEVTAGLFDLRRADLGEGSFSSFLLDIGTFSAAFDLIVTQTDSGLCVTAISDPGGIVAGSLEFPGAMEVDLATEHDGNLVTFLARQRGDGEYQTVGSVASTVRGPYRARFTLRELPKRVAVGLDRLEIIVNGPPPGPFTPRSVLIRLTHETLDDVLAGVYLLDGPDPDAAGAVAAFEAAGMLLDDAIELALDLGSVAPAHAALVRAREALAGAITATQEGLSLREITDAIDEAVFPALEAKDALLSGG